MGWSWSRRICITFGTLVEFLCNSNCSRIWHLLFFAVFIFIKNWIDWISVIKKKIHRAPVVIKKSQNFSPNLKRSFGEEQNPLLIENSISDGEIWSQSSWIQYTLEITPILFTLFQIQKVPQVSKINASTRSAIINLRAIF